MTTNRPARPWTQTARRTDTTRRTGSARTAGLLCLAACLMGPLAVGCSSAASGASSRPAAGGTAIPSAYATPAGLACGTTRTGANVPVVIKVTRGSVSCATALQIESGYAAMIRKGDLKGNGGGAPLTVSGWTCQGYPTPQVLQTGATSECHTASFEVVAVLDLPASSPSGTDRPPVAVPGAAGTGCPAAARHRPRRSPRRHAAAPGRRRPPPLSDSRRRQAGRGQGAGRAQAPACADHLHLVPAGGLGPVQRRVGGGEQLGQLPPGARRPAPRRQWRP